MRIQYAILVMMLLSASHQHEVVKRESGGEKRIVCYYTNWSVYRPGTAKFNPQNINPYLCTHLIYAFGGLDRENGLRPYDKYQDIEQGGYAKFTGLKTYNKALKTMLAIGGWNEGSARFSPLVADEERRKEFVKNVVKFLRINHFDGLDLDWEYPAYRDGGKPKDKENYAQLVQELREEFERETEKTGRPRLLLTMAVPAGIEYIDKGYDIPKLNKYLDFMNILSYDYHSAFEPSVNHHSPLYSIEEESEYNFDSQLTIDASVKHYILKGADPEKLVLGIPTYGRSYTLFNVDSTDLGSPSDGPGEQGDATREKGYLAYYEICANVKDGWTVVQPKETALGPYAYKGNQWVGYDDENIVRRKSQYVNEKNLGGIMFWSIDNDDFRGKCHSRPYPLIEAAKEALIGKAPGATSNKLPTPPRGGKGTGVSKSSSKLKNHRIPSTSTPAPVTQTTPDPPTTPDPGSDFRCKDEGFFPHPRDCKKYFWCLDSGPSNLGIVAHQFTCPSGLFFNKASDSCDFARNVICKKKSADSTTTTTTPQPSTGSKSVTTARTTTTSTTTTTEAPVQEEEEYYEEQEDPQTIKQLISLIKKLGGVAELEKQLEGNSNTDSTTPAISKSLYERVISNTNSRYQTLQRNGPTGPQNEGLPRESGRSSSFRKDKPTYVTIRRERPTTEKQVSEEYEKEEEEEVAPVEQERPKYTPIQRNRGSQFEGIELEKPTDRNKLKYQSVERFRPKVRDGNRNPTEEVPEEEAQAPTSERRQQSSTLRYTNIFRSRSSPPDTATSTTSRYVTLQRQRYQPSESEDVVTTENELIEDEEITEERILDTTTTQRPRVKISRSRRPFNRRPGGGRATTTTTSTEVPTTQRQRTTVQILKQRLNRFKSERGQQLRGTTTSTESIAIEDEASTTLRPRKAEFRRVIRPSSVQNLEESQQLDSSIEQSVAKDTVAKTRQYHRETSFRPQGHLKQTAAPVPRTEPPQAYVRKEQEAVTVPEESSFDSDDSIPDLANVAVAAIQSLATLPPTSPTDQYITTTIRPTFREIIETTQRPRPPPTRPHRPPPSTTPAIIPVRSVARSSPRPFSKVIPGALAPQGPLRPITPLRPASGTLYDEYDDFYAEPVEIPLSGKVRIHNDGYIECLDIGNFPHPFSCRKFISCAKMENSHLLGWEYTCPKGLSFDPIGGICNWNAGLGCKE
uniref:Chitotriosidase-1 n=2 Tax=Lygus hesperus TaxID=30085 RepID=A0A0K8T485_LYGHE